MKKLLLTALLSGAFGFIGLNGMDFHTKEIEKDYCEEFDSECRTFLRWGIEKGFNKPINNYVVPWHNKAISEAENDLNTTYNSKDKKDRLLTIFTDGLKIGDEARRIKEKPLHQPALKFLNKAYEKLKSSLKK